MITIRSPKAGTKGTLVCVDVTLTTPRSVYTISSDGALIDSGSPRGQGFFGGISWPVWRFRIADGLTLEQQMFLPNYESTVAMSWALRGHADTVAQLVVRPFFCGCGRRLYPDVGFQFDTENNGGRLTWLPNVRGPRLVADTNGRYHDAIVRSVDCFCEETAASSSREDLIAPGRFEFELNRRPAVLILSVEDGVTTRLHHHVGVFLAGLMREKTGPSATASRENATIKLEQPMMV